MKTTELIIKCYAKQEEGIWVAVCLDLGLAAQGNSFDESKRKLEEQIVFYVDEALQDKEYGSQLLSRKAPLSSWVEYYSAWILTMLCHKVSIKFDEIMPLRPA
ncbi:MAG: DUF1902 domain-containing protein [Methylobacter sp.]|nr:DUF1902 domain-containing protein [Methylobacter sp.]